MNENNNVMNDYKAAGKLKGKVAVITGAGGGIGAAAARIFAAEGASVLITDIQESKLREVAADIKAADGNVSLMVHDIADETQWRIVVKTAVNLFGRVDILVNNAGITGNLLAPFEERSVSEFNRVLSINLTGQFIGMKSVIPYMSSGSAIINVSSIAGITGNAGGNAYTASKGGSRMLSKGAAIDLAAKGIRVNSLHPGYVETPMTHNMEGADAFRKMAIGSTPLGRGASPEELAKGILFLASDDSSFMTGAELIMDGGFTAF
ncbi:SDR family NAD(P)-dependent oxidoreductase [Chitinophaga sp. CF418]|uniref:SDR family NAD(P)-dependent oxidoreductase n=1 Tax=Chitinophaga sp. CF418 TaxID=1855287 RepID=UPI00091C26BE|nr:SDR family oxidoreductase [Chitinophaga sp. CF418]SHN35887.1 NAD(P)-dependent dehydrogenase, short-chain alcohol dehydrogenase family [Chitinophaga sp. CF418]